MAEDPRDRGDQFIETALLGNLCPKAMFASGEELRRKGDHYRDMYVVTDGRVGIQLQPGQGTETILVGPGSPVGEIGFLNGCRATATATAQTATEVLVLNDETLWRIEREEPDVAVLLLRALARTGDHRMSFNASMAEDQDNRGGADVEVLLCRNDDMLEEALRMRYRVYCEELGRSSPYADHERRVIRDNLDDFGHTFVALEAGETIGTLRCNFSSEGPLGTLEKLYGMLASPNHPEFTMICTKFIVRKSKRGGPASMSMIAAMARYGQKEGMRDCFIDSIPALVPIYKRLGFEPAAEEFFHYENGPSLPMVLSDVTGHAERLAARRG